MGMRFDETFTDLDFRPPNVDGPEQSDSPGNDTLIRGLSREQRARLAIDAWEPSLLRNLLQAEGHDVRRRKPRRES